MPKKQMGNVSVFSEITGVELNGWHCVEEMERPCSTLMTLLHLVELCPGAELSSSGGCGSRHLYRDPSLEGTIQYLTVYKSLRW